MRPRAPRPAPTPAAPSRATRPSLVICTAHSCCPTRLSPAVCLRPPPASPLPARPSPLPPLDLHTTGPCAPFSPARLTAHVAVRCGPQASPLRSAAIHSSQTASAASPATTMIWTSRCRGSTTTSASYADPGTSTTTAPLRAYRGRECIHTRPGMHACTGPGMPGPAHARVFRHTTHRAPLKGGRGTGPASSAAPSFYSTRHCQSGD